MTNSRDIEKQIIEKDNWLLTIGVVIAMVIVWLTLNAPDKETLEINRQCYELCKEVTYEKFRGKEAELRFGLRTQYVMDIRNCTEECMDDQKRNRAK